MRLTLATAALISALPGVLFAQKKEIVELGRDLEHLHGLAGRVPGDRQDR